MVLSHSFYLCDPNEIKYILDAGDGGKQIGTYSQSWTKRLGKDAFLCMSLYFFFKFTIKSCYCYSNV